MNNFMTGTYLHKVYLSIMFSLIFFFFYCFQKLSKYLKGGDDDDDDEKETNKQPARNDVREQKIARFQETKQLENAIKVTPKLVHLTVCMFPFIE